MKKAMGLLLLAALLIVGCAETASSGVTGRAATCAMCGASVNADYFTNTTDRSLGPGQGW